MTHFVKALIQREEGAPTNKITVIASTDSVDRAGDVVDQSTWNLDHYRANPVILWAHQSGGGFDGAPPLPIGRAKVDIREGALVAEIEWDTGHDLGAQVARQFSEGFLNAVSVGFRPGRMVSRSDLEDADPRKGPSGYVLLDNELLEISAVPIPANQDALALRSAEETLSLKTAITEGIREALSSDDECQRLIALIADTATAPEDDLEVNRDDWWEDPPAVVEDEDDDWF